MSRKPQEAAMSKFTARLTKQSKEDLKVIKAQTGFLFNVEALRYAIHRTRQQVEAGSL